MSVVTVSKDREDVVRELARYPDAMVHVLGCGKCARVSRTGGRDQVIEMRAFLKTRGVALTAEDLEPLTVEDGACDPDAVGLAAGALRNAGIDALLVLACGAGLHCVASAMPGTTIIPGLDTLGPGVKDQLSCLACGDCRFAAGECKMVALARVASEKLSGAYAGAH